MISGHLFPYRTPAIRIEQPLGVFFIASIPAKILLEISYSTPATAIRGGESSLYGIIGSQRSEKEERLKEIAKYIDTVEAAFPNSIILGANYNEDGELVTDNDKRWSVESTGHDEIFNLIIPGGEKIASLIDGQHRLHAFEYADPSKRNMPLLCAIYLDIPLPYHAYIFATINFNQKKVDRSLAYDLFGFNLDEGSSQSWAPETLAVYLVRLLNTDEESPFKGRIKLGVQDELTTFISGGWQVSMATIVDGILSLISSNPKRDRYLMHKKSITRGRSRGDLKMLDSSPLRNTFIKGNDKAIYSILLNFFKAVEKLLWAKAQSRSFIKKTVGVQALFDLLRMMLIKHHDLHSLNYDFFLYNCKFAEHIDFSNDFFQASGTGRNRIKNALAIQLGLVNLADLRISEKDLETYRKIIQKQNNKLK